ncbi:unnamed protein product [Staurois parvus]|uniref:Uncharacterized protein n=1 Tax=Staurois parvus TaxID=386267 RepID=A0ABN9CB34_9NEOB|nr:unnamed protein product [Staurois parvus]
MQGPGRTGYSECRVRGERADIVECRVPGRADIVNAGSGRAGECRVRESGYSECRVRGDRL